jgi:hypothetical protein
MYYIIDMSQNLWQVVNMDDLLYFLRSGKNKIIVLSLVLLNTDEIIKRNIRKFIKRKSEIYTNITFLYYAIRDTDFKRISIISGNKDEYPKMCHIYNVTELLVEVTSIDNIDILESSFKKLHNYYINFIENENDIDVPKQLDNKNESKISTPQTPLSTNINNEIIKNPVVEKKKFIEKISLIKQKSDDYNIEFMRECQKRKKEEEKHKKSEEKIKKK